MADGISKTSSGDASGASFLASEGKTEHSALDTVFRRVIAEPSSLEAKRGLESLAKSLSEDHVIEYTDRLTDEELNIFLSITKPMTAPLIRTVVDGVIFGIKHLYIDEGPANAMAERIKNEYDRGKYSSGCESPIALKRAILKDLKEICPDKHLDIRYVSKLDDTYSLFSRLEMPSSEKLQEIDEEYIEYHREGNWGISNVRIFDENNVGYIKFDKFPPAHFEEMKGAIDAAMRTVAGTKALIIDLRDHEGGDPKTVALVASYLFDKPLPDHLCKFYERYSGRESVTDINPIEHPTRFGGSKPIICITSEKTFSAGEELTYDLQALGRATIIGEKTKGGANPTRPFLIEGTQFEVMIPHIRAISPYTSTNWEGVGVEPDIIAPYEDSLNIAKKKAIELSSTL
ncbi:MAG: S41 family peptidase [Simkaniaceae bacterium]|nr:S41 family peptidase [Simkaniaceae bacterium]